MNFFESPLSLLAANVLLLAVGAIALLALGPKSRSIAWVVRAALLLFVVDVFLAARSIPWGAPGGAAASWLKGWVLPPDQISAMTMGLSLDPKAIVASILAAALLAAFLADPRPAGTARATASAAIGAAGLSLTWSAATPWMAFFGLVVTLVGGYVPLCFDTAEDSRVANQYSWQRFGALLLMSFGATSLAGSHAPWLLFSDSMSSSLTGSGVESISGILLATGLFLIYQAFPVLTWSALPSSLAGHARLLLSYVFPGLAAFFLLAGVRKELLALQVFPAFGWIALFSSILAVVAGLFHSSKEAGLRAWLSGAGALSVSCLALVGGDDAALTAFAIYLAACLGAYGIHAAAAAGDEERSAKRSRKAGGAGVGVGIGVFLCVAAGAGFVGFASAGSWVSFFARLLDENPVQAFFLGIAYLGFVTLAFKLGMDFARTREASGRRPVFLLLLPYLLALATLGVVWRGSITGEALAFDGDQALTSVLNLVFATGAPHAASASASTALAIYGGLFVVGAILGIWISTGETESHIERWRRNLPRATAFISDEGFGMSPLAQKLLSGLETAGGWIERWVDTAVWDRIVPGGLFLALDKSARALILVSERISLAVAGGVRAMVEAPGRVMQLAQTGDVQWYLFFGLGAGLLICLYFLRG